MNPPGATRDGPWAAGAAVVRTDRSEHVSAIRPHFPRFGNERMTNIEKSKVVFFVVNTVTLQYFDSTICT